MSRTALPARLASVACLVLAVAAAAEGPAVVAPRRVVLIADGAGDFRKFSTITRENVRKDGLPIEVVTFLWSHGYRQQMADQTDFEHACRKGAEMAESALAILRADPGARLSFAGHSAGAMIALLGAGNMPPDSLHAVVLIGASVPADFDVRRTLRATRCGLHNFFSHKDRVTLGLLTRVLGTTGEPLDVRAAGRYAFQAKQRGPGDEALYTRLIQYSWQPSDAKLGHDGGHFGGYARDFERHYLFPIWMGD